MVLIVTFPLSGKDCMNATASGHLGKGSAAIHRRLPDFFVWILVIDAQLYVNRSIAKVIVFRRKRSFGGRSGSASVAEHSTGATSFSSKKKPLESGEIDFDVRANRQEQCIVCRVNDADKHRSACSAFQAVAFEAALVDMRLVAPIEHKRCVAFGACDFLRFRKVR